MSTSQAESTPVRFPCPQCDQLLSIREEKIGRKVRCPNCKVAVVVPNHEAAAEAMAEHRLPANSSRADDPFAEMVVYDDAPLKYDASYDEPEPQQQADDVDRDRVSISRSVIYGQGVLIAAVALVAFIMGFVIGGLAGTNPDDKTAVDRSPKTIRGRLVHKDDAGREIGDDGAVMIVLPWNIEQRMTDRLATAGLNPDAPQPHDANVRAIAELGGKYLRANDMGHFHLTLSPGKYYVLQISHNARRAGSESPTASDLQSMGKLLADASTLIGPYKYRWRSGVEIAKATTLDYSFD